MTAATIAQPPPATAPGARGGAAIAHCARPAGRPPTGSTTTGPNRRHRPHEQAAGSPYNITAPATGTATTLARDADEREPAEHEHARHHHPDLGPERDPERHRQWPEPRKCGQPAAPTP